jgi:hypothetical protein
MLYLMSYYWTILAMTTIGNLPHPQNKVSYPILSTKVFHYGLNRLDQGHLHSKLEVLRLTCPSRELNQVSEVGGNNLEKSHSNSLYCCYSEALHGY